MNELTIHYPADILWALDKTPGEFESEARLLLALKLYESRKLSTELAAQLAGMSSFAFVFELGRHGLSPFGEAEDELAQDMENAFRASLVLTPQLTSWAGFAEGLHGFSDDFSVAGGLSDDIARNQFA